MKSYQTSAFLSTFLPGSAFCSVNTSGLRVVIEIILRRARSTREIARKDHLNIAFQRRSVR